MRLILLLNLVKVKSAPMNIKRKVADDMSEKDFKKVASAGHRPLLPSHKIVYRSLRAANIVLKRVVTANEAIEFLTRAERKELTTNHPNPYESRFRKILTLLVARGIVFRSGKAAAEWYYGATEIINTETAQMPERRSRRERVLEAVRDAVAETKRALRNEEIWDYVKHNEKFSDFNQSMLSHDVLSLLQTGELKKIKTIRGNARGFNLYLPAELDESPYLPTEPMSWLEEVAKVFDLVWQRHLTEAEIENRKPSAVSTGEVRAAWVKLPNAHPKAFESLPIINAMGMLAAGVQHEPPKIRKIRRRGERLLLWCPIGYTDEMLDSGFNYLSDFERIEVAVKRAVKNTARPVTLADVKDEIDLDSLLHPIGKAKIRHVLMDASKDFIGKDGKPYRNKQFQRIYRVGILYNEVYYYHGTVRLEEAYSYVKSLAIESDWNKTEFGLRLEQLKRSSLQTIAFGNAKLLIAECRTLIRRIKSLLSEKLDAKSRGKMSELLNELLESEKNAKQAASANSLPEMTQLLGDVDDFVPGLTANDLTKAILLVCPGKAGSPDEKFRPRFWKFVLHMPNPNFKHRFTTDARQAAEFLFDRTDALTYAGSKWGGLECAFQARTARAELGRLRDARFIIPGLTSPDQRNRIVAVCCLAFLSGETGTEELLKLIRQDTEAGVRQSALWAYCFRKKDFTDEIVNEVLQNDPSTFVRQFALKCLSLDDREWWGL